MRFLSTTRSNDLEKLKSALQRRAADNSSGGQAITVATKVAHDSGRDLAVKQYGESSLGSPRDFVEPVATQRFNNALSIWALLAASGLLAMWFLGPAKAKQQQSALAVSTRELRFLRRRARKALRLTCERLAHSRDDRVEVYASPIVPGRPTVLCYAHDGETASSWGLVAAALQPYARIVCVARVLPASHDSRVHRSSLASQAADMQLACQVAQVQGPVISIANGSANFAAAAFEALLGAGTLPGVQPGGMLALDAQWMPDTLRGAHVPAVIAASRQLHHPDLLARLQLAPQQPQREDIGRITPTSTLGRGLDMAQRLTGGQESDLGQKGDRGVASMNQRLPLLAHADVQLLRELLQQCPVPLHCTHMLTSAAALPYNVSPVDNAQVFTTRVNGSAVLHGALHGAWSAPRTAPAQAAQAARAAANERGEQLRRNAKSTSGPAAQAAQYFANDGSAAELAGIKATLHPMRTLLTVVGASSGLLAANRIPEVQDAHEQLQFISKSSPVLLVEPMEPNVYHIPLQVPGAVLQALLPALTDPGTSCCQFAPEVRLLQTINSSEAASSEG